MRIIAGEFRGRKLLAPASDATRPVTDRVKQSMFDILAPLLPDAVVYDCFAGTGSMGLESLSRGARYVTFFEIDRSAVSRLRKNIALLEVAGRSRVVDRDVFRWFADHCNDPGEKADVVFLDPPYRYVTERAAAVRDWASQVAAHYLAPAGTVVFRHDAGDALDLRPLYPADVRKYGGMTVNLLRAGSPTTAAADEERS